MATIKFPTFDHLIPEICKDCKGIKYWDDDPSIRQKNVRDANDGKCPNPCVDNEGNGIYKEIKCPYRKHNHI